MVRVCDLTGGETKTPRTSAGSDGIAWFGDSTLPQPSSISSSLIGRKGGLPRKTNQMGVETEWKPTRNRTIQGKQGNVRPNPNPKRHNHTSQTKPSKQKGRMEVPAQRIETMEIHRNQDKQQPNTRNFGGGCGRKDPPDNAYIRTCHACEYRQEGMG